MLGKKQCLIFYIQIEEKKLHNVLISMHYVERRKCKFLASFWILNKVYYKTLHFTL